MFNLSKREQIIIIVAVVLIIMSIGMYMMGSQKTKSSDITVSGHEQTQKPENQETKTSQDIAHSDVTQGASEDKKLKTIAVHVKGQVKKSDVVYLDEGKRVCDAIEAVGGALDTADLNAINLAARLSDGQEVYVPAIGEKIVPAVAQSDSNTHSTGLTPAPGGKVNINTATVDELDKLPRIGPSTAQKIIVYRQQNNGFKSIEEIEKVSGIGKATYDQLKDLIDIR